MEDATLKDISHGQIEIKKPPTREEQKAMRAKRMEAIKRQEKLS